MFVDSLTKTATIPQHSAPGPGPADASKVLAKGVGLSKAYMGQKSSFTVDCSKAGPHKNMHLVKFSIWRQMRVLLFLKNLDKVGVL